MKIVIVSGHTGSFVKNLLIAYDEIQKEYGNILELKYFQSAKIDFEILDDEIVKKETKEADVVIYTAGQSFGKAGLILCEALRNEDNIFIPIGGDFDTMKMARIGSFHLGSKIKKEEMDFLETKNYVRRGQFMKKVISRLGGLLPIGALRDGRNWTQIMDYYNYGGKENFKSLLLLLLGEYGGHKHLLKYVKKPIKNPDMAIYHPKIERTFTSLDGFLSKYYFDKTKPILAILYYGRWFYEECLETINFFLDKLEKKANIIPVFSSIQNVDMFRKLLTRKGKLIKLDGIINLQYWRMTEGSPFAGGQDTIELLKELNVPVFNTKPMVIQEIDDWLNSKEGFNPPQVISGIAFPEIDACVEPIPISGLSKGKYEKIGEINTMQPIEDRIERLIGRVSNWLKIREKPNSEKKVAFIMFNYPPGEDNLGCAGYLDTFASMEKILKRLKQEGYNVGELPKEKLHKLFTDWGIVNSGKWIPKEKFKGKWLNRDEYQRLFEKLPEEAKKKMFPSWGELPGKIMCWDNNLYFPGIELGNIFIGLQPSRGIHEDPEKVYHDKELPPHHQYIGFYRWLEEKWEADICVHVGTHGTLELLFGKENGLTENCYPDILIGNMPHLYIYHIINAPSEGTVAHRRGYGIMDTHLSPAYVPSELYDELADLDELIREYYQARTHDPGRAEMVYKKILEVAQKANFEGGDIDSIYDQLYMAKRSLIPKGLHIFDEKYDEEDTINFIISVLRYDRGEIKSLNRILAEKKGLDYEYIYKNPSKKSNNRTNAEILAEIDSRVKEIVENFITMGVGKTLSRIKISGTSREDLKNTLEFAKKVVDNLNKTEEMNTLSRLMNGEYSDAGLAGDPIRTPEVLPLGRNAYEFEPNLIPTDIAYQRGAEVAENTIKEYFKKHNKYPQTVNVTLWAFETSETYGETIAQVLRYVGVRIKKKGIVKTPEIIPLEELKRPRIDVCITICGFFRDMFGNLITMMDDAFKMVAGLDEPDEMNYVKLHSKEIFEDAKKEFDEKTAKKISHARIYGPPPGEYATRVRPLIETSNWEKEEQIADVFIKSVNYVYADNLHCERADKIYRKLLSRVDIVSQIRSHHAYEVIDLDHYYEFFGGASKAVEVESGKKPEMYYSDSTKEFIHTESVEQTIRRGVRTRVLNPKWIDEMLKHEYHGAQHIKDRVEYVFAFAATTGAVDNWMFDKIAERYIFDEEMRKRLVENNRWATAEIINRLFEANKRGYWDATHEQLDKLKQSYLEIEGWIEEQL
ncbi:MAG: magnesium chelatase subunit H [Elusimicrobiota bacterium]